MLGFWIHVSLLPQSQEFGKSWWFDSKEKRSDYHKRKRHFDSSILNHIIDKIVPIRHFWQSW